MLKYLGIAVGLVAIGAVGYSVAFNNSRVSGHFGSADSSAQQESVSAQVRASTQIGYIENKSSSYNLRLAAQANGHTYIINTPKQLMKGQQDKYVMVLPFETGSANDKIVIHVSQAGASESICTYTITSAGSGEINITSNNQKICTVSEAGNLVIRS